MGRLHDLYDGFGQSPWLDNLSRSGLRSGQIAAWVDRGVRGITSNPTIFQKAMEASDYDEDLRRLAAQGLGVEECYWELACADVARALELLAPTHASSGGSDGFVSIEVDPALAHDREATVAEAHRLHDRLAAPHLLVKVPATPAGVEAVGELIGAGRSVNVTLIFSLDRYAAVLEAWLSGLEECSGDVGSVASVASFFISRVDTAVDRALEEVGTERALSLRGRAALAQGRLAYQLFRTACSGPRWEALAARGARPQRPLWASTSTKNPAYPDTLYVDGLIGPDTVDTLPEATLAAFDDHGVLARTLDADPEAERAVWDEIGSLVDLDAVATELERAGVAAFQASYTDILASLGKRLLPPA